MKRFHFALERVLALRRTQSQVEDWKLNRIRLELQQVDAQALHLTSELRKTENDMRSASDISGRDLVQLDNYRSHIHARRSQLERERLEIQKREQEQTAALIRKRREVTLLEKLRRKQYLAWATEAEREITQQAEESFSARWQKLQ